MMDVGLLTKILGFSLGFLYGEAFSQWDYMIKYATSWYSELSSFWSWFVASLLDTQHHFQYGLVIMLLSQLVAMPPLLAVAIYWMGLGLVISDWKDYEYIVKRMGLKK